MKRDTFSSTYFEIYTYLDPAKISVESRIRVYPIKLYKSTSVVVIVA